MSFNIKSGFPRNPFVYGLNFFKVPDTVKEKIFANSVQKNNFSLRILSCLFIIIELLNIGRIVLLSTSGLTTPRNQIYFSLYVSLILLSLLLLLCQKLLSKDSKKQMVMHFCAVFFIVLWSAAINALDLAKTPVGGATVYLTAIFGVVIFVQLKPVHIVLYSVAGFLFFSCLAFRVIDSGVLINLAIATIVAAIVSITKFNYAVVELMNQRDILEANRQLIEEQEKLRLSLEKHKIIMQQSNDSIFEWDPESDTVDFSNNWSKGRENARSVHNFCKWISRYLCLDLNYRALILDIIDRCRKGTLYVEEELQTVVGHWYLLRVTMLCDKNGKPVKGIGVLVDIQKQKDEIRHLEGMLEIDSSIGVLNKVAIMKYMDHSLSFVATGPSVAAFIIDMDNFKQVNDCYGHPCGDFVLLSVANILKSIFKDGVGRIGGDEFLVVMPNVKESHTVERKAETLMQEMLMISWEGHALNICCSVGIAMTQNSQTTHEQLYKIADEALYHAKRMGKNSYHVISI